MATAINEKLNRLQTYLASLKQRLSGQVPSKHAKSPGSIEAFKQMLQIDIRKTEAQIKKLTG